MPWFVTFDGDVRVNVEDLTVEELERAARAAATPDYTWLHVMVNPLTHAPAAKVVVTAAAGVAGVLAPDVSRPRVLLNAFDFVPDDAKTADGDGGEGKAPTPATSDGTS